MSPKSIPIPNMLGSANYRKATSKEINFSNVTAIKPKKPVPRLSLCVLNAQSVRNLKASYINNYIVGNKFDCVAITET